MLQPSPSSTVKPTVENSYNLTPMALAYNEVN